MIHHVFSAISKDQDILLKSSSGGVFWQLAKYVIKQKGVVFGASWTKDWNVDITYAETIDECKKFMTSKYVLANVKDSYSKCKQFLDNGRIVLFVGIACQNHGLRNFLRKKYNNLILVDVACHGLPSIQVWRDFLDTIKKPNSNITNINFRDKTEGWRNFSFRVDYSDGVSLIEPHKKNKYMRAFLGDNYLRDCCYKCTYKNINSCADIIIGDFWTIEKVDSIIDNRNGVSFIIVNTKKGNEILDAIKSDLYLKEYSCGDDVYTFVGLKNKISKKKTTYSKNIYKKRIGIITLAFQQNMGGVIQVYALQQALKKLGYDSFAYNATKQLAPEYIKFIYEYINFIDLGQYKFPRMVPYDQLVNREDLSAIIVGSDQIWRKEWNNINNVCLDFASSWKINKVMYGASMGTNTWNFDDNDNIILKKFAKQFTGISVREFDLIKMTKQNIGIKPKLVLDPTMLLSKEDYEKICEKIERKNGIFTYILDNTQKNTDIVNGVSKVLGIKTYSYDDKKLEDWLAGFRDANLVVTDSFHGCIFSIIFNKPFICIKNYKRGISRFNSLEHLFNLKERFVDSMFEINFRSIFQKPNCEEAINFYKKKSYDFLRKSLTSKPKIIK